MDLVSAIGLISSFVTLEEAGRSWILIIKDKIKRKEIDINNWDSDDPLVQVCLDRFKTDMGDKYKDHIFSKEEIQDIIRGFFEQNRELRIGNEEKKQMTQIIEDILYAYNEYAKSLMSSGERTLHNTLSSDFSKIMDKLGMIEEQPRKENIKKFLRAIEISKEIELENIEELINGEYEIDRSEIIETIQAGREKLVSIQGNAGSGKSVVCKKLLKGKECHGSYNNFFDEIEKIGRCIYRRYQIWISNKLFVQEAREKFVYTLLTDNSIEANWKKQTEIGIVKSKYCGMFFKEFQELLGETVIEELLDITNLYAFEAKINHSPALIMNVTPIGAARENLIGMVFEERISLDKNRTSIIKLCDDYANCFYKTADTEEKAYKIIIRYIDELIEKGKEEKSYYQHDEEIVQLFLIVAKMAKSSKSWLKEFVENMIVEYCSGTSRRDSVAEEILKAVVKKCPLSFAMELPELACESAETLWGQRVSRKHFKYDGYDHNNVRAYGLSDNADHFDNNENGVYNNTFFWYVMRCDFVKGLGRAISCKKNTADNYHEARI